MKTISFINQKGGVGKSLLADELAFEFERKGLLFNFYDLDGQGGLLHEGINNDNAEYNIIDTPGQLTKDTANIIKESDIIIVPTRAAVKEMEPFERTLQLIQGYKKDTATVIIVLNGWNRFTIYSQFEDWLKTKYPMLNKIITIPQSEALSQAEAYGQSVISYQPKSKVSEQLLKLWAIVECQLGLMI